MTAQTIVEWLDVFVLSLRRLTVIVLDNAPAHRSKEVRQRLLGWQERGLYVFFLPPRYFAGQKPVFTASQHCRDPVAQTQV